MSLKETMVGAVNKNLKTLKKAVNAIGHRRTISKNPKRQELQRSLEKLTDDNVALIRQIKEKQMVIEKEKQNIASLNYKYENEKMLYDEDRRFLTDEINLLKGEIRIINDDLRKAKQENEILKNDYEVKLQLLARDKNALIEEHKTLKENVHDNTVEINKLKKENKLLKEECEKKEKKFNEQLENKDNLFKETKCKLKGEILKLRMTIEDIQKENMNNNYNNKRNNFGGNNNRLQQDVESLKAVLEIKQEEIKNMRFELSQAKLKEYELDAAQQQAQLYKTQCENLREQLTRKYYTEKSLSKENSKLRKSVLQENIQKRRLSCENEELQWKLRLRRRSDEPGCSAGKSSLPKVKNCTRK